MAFDPSPTRWAANLTTILTCGPEEAEIDALASNALCSYVPKPRVRGTVEIYLAFLFPLLLTAFGTVFMQASRSWISWVMDILCRLFFPELGLYRIVEEEVRRSSVMKALQNEGYQGTKSQLMAIQRGLLYISNSPSTDFTHTRKKSLVSTTSPITWCAEPPREGANVVEIEEIDTYRQLLQILPAGPTTWEGIGCPGIGTVILSLQLVWIIVSICFRLKTQLHVSLVELFALYALTAFVAERLVTLFRVPAWTQRLVVKDITNPHGISMKRDEEAIPKCWQYSFYALPLLQSFSWAVFLILYGKLGTEESWSSRICLAAGIAHVGATVGFGMGVVLWRVRKWKWLAYGTFALAALALLFSRAAMLGFALVQIYVGERAIFLVPDYEWTLPHIGG